MLNSHKSKVELSWWIMEKPIIDHPIRNSTKSFPNLVDEEEITEELCCEMLDMLIAYEKEFEGREPYQLKKIKQRLCTAAPMKQTTEKTTQLHAHPPKLKKSREDYEGPSIKVNDDSPVRGEGDDEDVYIPRKK